jgi:DNA-binding LacI/PurR family transcriptional regulator
VKKNSISVQVTQLHHKVAELLRAEILANHKTGDKLEGERGMAARFGVSVGTLREALRSLTQAGLLRRRHGSGTFVNCPAVPAGERSIALLCEYNLFLAPTGANFYGRLMHELRQYLKSKGCSSRFYIGQAIKDEPNPTELTCSEFLEDLALNRVSGVVATATLPMNVWVNQTWAKGIPVIGMGGLHCRFNGAVDPDIGGAIRSAVRQFVGNGRLRPAYIGWDPGSSKVFKTELVEAGLEPNPRWTRGGFSPSDPGAGWSDFREIWASSEEKPDCVIFGDDALFKDACSAMQSCGVQIPTELEVVVFSNKGTLLPQPFPYTRWDCDPREFAEMMGTLLVQCLSGERPERQRLVVPYRLTPNAEDREFGEVVDVAVEERK